LLSFLAKVILISSTGALAPGPLTAATAAIGVKNGWRGGFWVSVGHLVVELPLVLLISFGIASILTAKWISSALSLVGGVFLLFFAYLTMRDAIKVRAIKSSATATSPLLTGASLSAFNPFFIAWWIGVGSPLIVEALEYWGSAGIAIFYVSHVWLDFAWLMVLARMMSVGGMNIKVYRVLLLILSAFVILFAVGFIYYGITGKRLLF